MNRDEELYYSYLNGDIKGLESLVIKYSDNLIYFINSYLNNINEAEDIMMNTFMAIMVHKVRFKENSSFKTYLFAIAKNKAIDFIKKNKKNIQNFNDVLKSELNLENTIFSDELKSKIYLCLNKMPGEYKDIIYLTFIAGMTLPEVAQALKKNIKQIYNLNNRAKLKLKEILEKEGVNNEIL